MKVLEKRQHQLQQKKAAHESHAAEATPIPVAVHADSSIDLTGHAELAPKTMSKKRKNTPRPKKKTTVKHRFTPDPERRQLFPPKPPAKRQPALRQLVCGSRKPKPRRRDIHVNVSVVSRHPEEFHLGRVEPYRERGAYEMDWNPLGELEMDYEYDIYGAPERSPVKRKSYRHHDREDSSEDEFSINQL